MILLDTHVMLWLRLGDARLGASARSAIDQAWQSDELCVSAVSFWEVALLKSKQRIRFPEDVGLWRREQLEQGAIELPLDGSIAIARPRSHPRGRPPDLASAGGTAFHADWPGHVPTASIVVATALEGHRLVTADRRILDWPGQVSRLDARYPVDLDSAGPPPA